MPLRFRRPLFLLGLLFLLLTFAGWRYFSLPDVTVLKDRRATVTITVRDWQGREHPFRLGPKNPDWVPLGSMPEAMKWAVIVAEDANFYEHEGVDLPALKEAFRYNLERKRLARGASTITQQLAKNVFLSRERSLLRKVEELILARRMERELEKGRILELYLNVVELGPLVHGVGEGARYHFGKQAAELTAAECAFLAAMLPGPRVAYNPKLKPQKVQRRADWILKLLARRGIGSRVDEPGEEPEEPSEEEGETVSEEPEEGAEEVPGEEPEEAPVIRPEELPATEPELPVEPELPAVEPEEVPATEEGQSPSPTGVLIPG